MPPCLQCHGIFESSDPRRKYCSRPCYLAHTQAAPKPIYTCTVCHTQYTPQTVGSKFCSLACSGKSRIRKVSKVCVECGKDFQVMPCHADHSYCSLDCYRNRKPEEVHKTCLQCGQPFTRGMRDKDRSLCSIQCQHEWTRKPKDEYTCKMCHQKFYWPPSRKKTNPVYCSIPCRDKDPENKARLIRMQVLQQNLSPNRLETLGCDTLTKAGIRYETQYAFRGKFVVDAVMMNHPIVIQFDGDYWHGHPSKYNASDRRQQKRMALDKSQDAYMRSCGYEVVRVWESEMHADPSILITRIQQAIATTPTPTIVPSP